MKKLFIAFMTVLLLFPVNVEAKTLNDLKTELAFKKAEWEENQKRIAELESEIQDLNSSISSTIGSIETTKNEIGLTEEEIDQKKIEIEDTRNDIAYKEDKINEKDQEIEELLHFYQMTNGNMAYLEFVFGAKDFADFLRRINTVTQISNYNTELIEEIDTLVVELEADVLELGIKVEELEEAKAELERQKEELIQKNNELNNLLSLAYKEKDTKDDLKLEIDKEIELMEDTIELYEDMGCDPNKDVSQCFDTIPPDTEFLRPLERGYVTSEYGYRVSPVGGGNFHSGIDLGGASTGTTILAAASGTVIATYYDKYGGNQVVIHHYVDGKEYSTLYAHMQSVSVSKGQTVDRNTKVGTLGNTGSSTGPHLHFTVLDGFFLLNYGWDQYYGRTRNPRDFINFPSTRYVYFENRLIEYN